MNKLTRELKVIVRNGKAELDLPDFPDGEVIVQVERPFNPETDRTSKEWFVAAIKLLRQFALIHLTAINQERAMQMQRRLWLSHNVELADCLIAAACARMRAPLYTRNLKHMRPLLGDLAVSPLLKSNTPHS